MKNIVAQFVPILLIYVLLSNFKMAAHFSHTILGKLIAIAIVIFYTSLDKLLGLFVCSLVILYYQSDVIENLLNMDEVDIVEQNDILDDGIYLENEVNDKPSKNNKLLKHGLKEHMTNYTELYDDLDASSSKEKAKDAFRKQSCDKSVLMQKGLEVKKDMAEHVYPELKFTDGTCNACDKACDFSIIESKLKTETELIPKTKEYI